MAKRKDSQENILVAELLLKLQRSIDELEIKKESNERLIKKYIRLEMVFNMLLDAAINSALLSKSAKQETKELWLKRARLSDTTNNFNSPENRGIKTETPNLSNSTPFFKLIEFE